MLSRTPCLTPTRWTQISSALLKTTQFILILNTFVDVNDLGSRGLVLIPTLARCNIQGFFSKALFASKALLLKKKNMRLWFGLRDVHERGESGSLWTMISPIPLKCKDWRGKSCRMVVFSRLAFIFGFAWNKFRDQI